jgi:hypothetical protein
MDEYNEHVIHFKKCLGFVGENGIEGDILEFGVGGGETLLILERLADDLLKQKQNMSYRLFGFDSFQGLPEPKGIDRDAHVDPASPGAKFTRGMYKHTRATVSNKLRREAVNADDIQLVEGWYEEVLTSSLREQLLIERASLINIDCDFYESAAVVLEWCEPIIGQGTVISFDDWFCYKGRPDHGEQHAFHEFLDNNPDVTAVLFSTYSWHGKAFIINRSGDPARTPEGA